MDQYIFALTVISLALLAVISLALIFIVYQLIKLKSLQQNQVVVSREQTVTPIAPENQSQMMTAEEALEEQNTTANCINHPKLAAVGSCSICEETFCSICLKNHKNLHLCKDHLETFLSNDWGEITTVHTNPNQPEKGIFLYDFKRAIWKDDQTPTYIQTQYKINLESDEIESFVALYGRINEVADLKEKIEQLHN